uniref:Uncharacterized protein n=1 Tax=virus sp. ctmTa7 TaxID=2828255 RepID=A0A8S5RC24_9VIRU|nr:MAG TPA: hypothetical protein [virus sp. ctmTa7]
MKLDKIPNIVYYKGKYLYNSLFGFLRREIC